MCRPPSSPAALLCTYLEIAHWVSPKREKEREREEGRKEREREREEGRKERERERERKEKRESYMD